MTATEARPKTGADALLFALRDTGVDYLFANAGTDFAPLIEGLARLPASMTPVPVTIPHETAAVGMAHGYWLVTGKPQALMVHVNVGLANSVMGVLNAMADNVPMLVLSGRPPLTETGRPGGRVTPIQHGQEMFDQSGLVRGTVKFEYEIRYPKQCDSVLRRAAAVARSDPAGPVYLSLPREPLAEALPEAFAPAPREAPATPAAPDAAAIDRLAGWIGAARAPVVLCQRGDPGGTLGTALSEVANRHGFAVCEPFPVRNVMATADPAFAGCDPAAALEDADLVIAFDCGVPWIAAISPPDPGARVVHIGPDPLFGQRPVRGFRSDLSITTDPTLALHALDRALGEPVPRHRPKATNRRPARATAPKTGEPMAPALFSQCISDIMDEDAVVFSEIGLLPAAMHLKGTNRCFGSPHSGGLGWGFPAALGAQLADRSRLVIAAIGDGSYMFANPLAFHQVAAALTLPVLVAVKNNGMWNAVRRAVKGGYPNGSAVRQNEMPLTSLAPLPDFATVARASRAHAERIEEGADLPGALSRAFEVIRQERRQVLLDVRVSATDSL